MISCHKIFDDGKTMSFKCNDNKLLEKYENDYGIHIKSEVDKEILL